jgi:hypothetical protein
VTTPTTQFTLYAEVLELRALHMDGRAVHVPVAINNTDLGNDPGKAIGVMQRRILEAQAMAEAMFAARPVVAETETKGPTLRQDMAEIARVLGVGAIATEPAP